MGKATRILTVLGFVFSVLVTLFVLDVTQMLIRELAMNESARMYSGKVLTSIGDRIFESPLSWISVTAFFFLIFGVMLAAPYSVIALFTAKYYRKNISIGDSKGTTVVSLSSLEALLERALEAEEDVRSASVDLSVTSRKSQPLSCEITLTLYEQDNVTGRTSELRDLVKRRFSSILPLEYSISPVMTIRFAARPGERNRERADAVAAPEPQFSGPQYPVEPEDNDDESSF